MPLPPSIDLQIVTPRSARSFTSRWTRCRSPAPRGISASCPGTRPLLASLAVGELWYRKGQEKTYLSIAYGFAEVLPDRVTILARLAERAQDIDVERADAARQRAEERLTRKSDVDYERARAALLKSLTRLQVAARAGISPRSGALKRLRT